MSVSICRVRNLCLAVGMLVVAGGCAGVSPERAKLEYRLDQQEDKFTALQGNLSGLGEQVRTLNEKNTGMTAAEAGKLVAAARQETGLAASEELAAKLAGQGEALDALVAEVAALRVELEKLKQAPATDVGKLDEETLRKLVAQQVTTREAERHRPAIEHRVKQLVDQFKHGIELNEEQKKKLETLRKEAVQTVMAQAGKPGAGRWGGWRLVSQHSKELQKKMQAVLTPEQRQQYFERRYAPSVAQVLRWKRGQVLGKFDLDEEQTRQVAAIEEEKKKELLAWVIQDQQTKDKPPASNAGQPNRRLGGRFGIWHKLREKLDKAYEEQLKAVLTPEQRRELEPDPAPPAAGGEEIPAAGDADDL